MRSWICRGVAASATSTSMPAMKLCELKATPGIGSFLPTFATIFSVSSLLLVSRNEKSPPLTRSSGVK